MFGNYLVTALRNLERNRLYAAITILGLAAAFAAAILIAQFVRHEFTYDHWVPGYQQVYKIVNELDQPGQPRSPGDTNQAVLPAQLKAVFPGIEAIARVNEAFPTIKHRSGDTGVSDPSFAWVDPDIFKVFPLPALAGDPASALQQPDTVVITRSVARKYFHRDLPIGDTLLVQAADPPPPGADLRTPTKVRWRPMRVAAVLKDLPSNTNLTTEIFASGRSAYSSLAELDARPPVLGGVFSLIFVRLSPGFSAADLQRALDVATKPESNAASSFAAGAQWLFHPLPIDEAHLTPPGQAAPVEKPVGSRSVAYGIAGVGALIVLVAAINFVTLMTARAARRGVEVGVRKSVGAARRDLMVQFIGEALIQVAVAALVAVALAEILVKPFSAFIQRDLALDFVHDPVVLAGIAGAALATGLMAAIYPALVLSSFQPAAVLKGGVIRASGSPLARSTLVVVQFAILIGLISGAATLYRQTQFALNKNLGSVDDRLIYNAFVPCGEGHLDQIRKLPGVAGAACSSINAVGVPVLQGVVRVQLGGSRQALFDMAPVDFGFFELYGVKPLAGRLFRPDHGEDGVLADPSTDAQPTVILNETAARQLGFSDPRAAVGRLINWGRLKPGAAEAQGPPPFAPSTIVGVVPDTPTNVRTAADPVMHYVTPGQGMMSIKLTGQDVPGTVKAINDIWKQMAPGAPPPRETFLSGFRLNQYLDLIIQRTAIAICAGLAILIACLGLFALSAYTTERRTKEIGVRKAMGANTRDVVFLLLWQFTIPVLAASTIAIPLGLWAVSWWLRGFVYHVPLSAWTFVLAPAAAVAIAWLTVSYQSFMVARAKPAGALRYE
jgi:putative ABC transport system permease protein